MSRKEWVEYYKDINVPWEQKGERIENEIDQILRGGSGMIVEITLFKIVGKSENVTMINTDHIVTIEPCQTTKLKDMTDSVGTLIEVANIHMTNGENYLTEATYDEFRDIIKNRVQGGDI